MDVLQEYKLWIQTNEFNRVIKAIESYPETDHTIEMDLALARAYDSLTRTPQDRDLNQKIVKALGKHQEEGKGNYAWNMRMGCALANLNQNAKAQPYFLRALEIQPDDPAALQALSAARSKQS